MTIFIFRPHVKWVYCNGTKIVIAEDYERALRLLIEMSDYPQALYVKSDISGDERNGKDIWVLAFSFKLDDSQRERCILNSWKC